MIIIIEIGITSQDQLQIVESETMRKYDVLENVMGAMHNCDPRIIPYVMTWDGIVTKFHRSYSKEIGLTTKTEAYIRYIVLKKTLESISFEYRRGSEDPYQGGGEETIAAASKSECQANGGSADVVKELAEE